MIYSDYKTESKSIDKGSRSFMDNVYLFLLFLYFVIYMLPFNELFGYLPCFLVIVYSISTKPFLKFSLNYYHWWSIQVLVFFLISSFWALRPVLSFWAIMQMLKLFVLSFSVYKYCSSPDRLLDVFRVFIFTNFLLLVFILFYFDLSTLGEDRVSDTENGLNGNFLASNFTFCLYIIFIILNLFKVPLKTKLIYLVLSFLFFLTILLTGSRTGLILLVLPLGLYQFLKSRYKIISLISVFLLVVISFFIVMKIPFFYNVIGVRLEDGFNVISGNSDGTEDINRLLLYIFGIEWFHNNPLLGVGINNFRALSNVTAPFKGLNWYAHSNIIELLVDIGVVGFLIYYKYIFILFAKVKKVKNNFVKRIIIVLAISFFVRDFFSVSYYQIEMYFLMSITFAMLSIYEDKMDVISIN